MYHGAVPANPLNFSVRAFRFRGSTAIYLQCAIQRCMSTQCAMCGDGRRLANSSSEEMQESAVMLEVSEQFDGLVLPLVETSTAASTTASSASSGLLATTTSSTPSELALPRFPWELRLLRSQ